MSELMPPEPMHPQTPGRGPWPLWGTIASAMLHVGVLVFLLLQPPPDSVDAAPPSAIDVELVPPPEAASPSTPPEEEPVEEPEEEAAEEPAEEPEAEEAAEAEEQAEAEAEAEEQASAAAVPPANASSAEPPPAARAAAAAEAAAEVASPETPAETAAPETVPEASATEAPEPVRGSGTTSAKVAPIPLSRPIVRGLTAPESVPDEAVAAVTADTGEVVEGTAPPAPLAEPDVTTLELGALRSAERFYSEVVLNAPSMAQARATLETLPPERRLAQTCSIEALAQIGNAGEGFTPDVVMTEAYARSEMTGTRLAASGAIFRSGESWYGLAFDCKLSDDLSSVTAFSYRLGADVTDAVLARLSRN
jgi:hypothetical protein